MSESREKNNLENSDELTQKFISKSNDKIDNNANIGHSGNSNVDVNVTVQIDTKAIAYALLCSSLARKEMSNDEFSFAINKLEELLDKKPKSRTEQERPRPWSNRQLFRHF